MPKPLDLPPDRFFARVDRFTCECPACGVIISTTAVRTPAPAHLRKLRRDRRGTHGARGRELQYNPLTSRLCCPECRRVWAVGLVLYPVIPRSTARPPSDQTPTWDQLMAIRQLTSGYLKLEPISGSEPVNLTIAQACSCACPEVANAYDPFCPLHGTVARRARPTEPGTPEPTGTPLPEIDPDPATPPEED